MKKTLLLFLILTCLQINAQCWKTVTAGYSYTVATQTDNSLWSWGENKSGQLGDGTVINNYTPQKIGTATDWKIVVTGTNHTVALKTDGSLWAWGSNKEGQLGDGTSTNKSTPTRIGTATNWQTVAAGNQYTIALKTDGTLWAWGDNYFGELGTGSSSGSSTPKQVGTATDWKSITVGYFHTIALKTDGTLWTWGGNDDGQLGDGTTSKSYSPKKIGTATDWKTICGGGSHTLAIKTDGSLWAWGKNAYGELGNGTTTSSNVPTKIGTSTDWKNLGAAGDHTIAIKTDGSLWNWGYNSHNELGNGTTLNSLIPVQIGASKSWQDVAAGWYYTAAVSSDGVMWTFGDNADGQLGDGTNTYKNVPITVACPSSLVLTTEQANITCFGDKNGSASVTAVSGGTAPYTYLWSNGKTTSSITGLAAGEYSCTVTDAASLSVTKTFSITQPVLLNLIVTATNSACNANNGSITATATGGTLPYQYAISFLPYQSSNVFAGLSPGTYTINARDNNGCVVSNIIVLSANDMPPTAPNTQTFNNTATVANLKAFGINPQWYSVPVGGTALNLSTLLQTGTYYVSQTVDGCESLRATVNVTITLPSGNEQIPANGLVAYYPFDGNANDASGNKSNGSVAGTVLTSDRFGNINSAYNFNGTDSFINAVIPNIPQNNSSRTISGWFKTDNVFSDPKKFETCIFNYGALEKSKRISLYIYSKGYLEPITGADFSSDDFYVDNYNYSNNDWYFFTLTYNGTKLSLYVNGKFVSEKAVALNTTNNIFRLGETIPDVRNEWFKGTIDDVAIWNRVLTPQEISAMYTPAATNNYTLIPDANFEKKLIDLGMDSGAVDGKVLTSNISTVKFLDLTKSNISDLTGIQDFVSLTDLYCGQNSLTTINVSKNIALTTLDCNNNKITSLDVSNNIALLNLSCYANQLTALDVRVNTALTKLDSGSNKYTALDVSSNTALTFLGCNTSLLTSLDLSKNTALTLLDCRENKLTHLDVSKITTLTELYCQSNQLTNLDISKNKALEFLNGSKNQLTTLDVSVNTALVGLYANSNQLTSLNLKNANNVKFAYLNLTNNPNLTCIQVDDVAYSNANWSAKKDAVATYNEVCTPFYTFIPDVNFEKKLIGKGLDSGAPDGKVLTANIASVKNLDIYNSSISNLTGIEGFSALEVLNCGKNQIKWLDFSQNTKLKQLECYENKLDSLNVSQNADLLYLDCFTNKLTTLDLSKNNSLTTVYCYDNLLTNLNVSNLKNLESLDCPDNQLTNLDVSTNIGLKELHCYRNKLKTLDISKNIVLYDLVCYSNELTYLNLKNGNNSNFILSQYTTKFTNNPDLTCIKVDSVAYSNANWADRKDVTASYSTDCSPSFVAIPDPNFEQKLIDLGIDTDGLNGRITIANITAITSLDLSNSNIKNLTGIENFTSLTYLDVSNNQLTILDVSKNILLETLNASSNQLTTLDLSKNNKLTIVYIANNPLVSLNLRNGNNKNFILPAQTAKKSGSGLYTSFLGLTTLGCIQVDDADYSNANWSNIKEPNTSYSNTCKNLGVEDSVFAKATIYPNPTNGEVNISNIILEKANVYNDLGQLVKTFTLDSNNTNNTINLAGLSKGIYYIYLINQDAATAKKIIVE